MADYMQWDNPDDYDFAIPESTPMEDDMYEDMEYDDPMADEMEQGPEYYEDEYDDSQRLDELNCLDDYNRWEEEQVFQDREWEDY